jgi:hypothetical protein
MTSNLCPKTNNSGPKNNFEIFHFTEDIIIKVSKQLDISDKCGLEILQENGHKQVISYKQ